MYYDDYGMSPVKAAAGVYSEQSDNPNSTATNSNGTVPVGQQGVYYSEDTQQSSGVVNIYGGDIANFEKFKGNDKSDAMGLTNAVATDVKKAYMELLHKLEELRRADPNFQYDELTFEPMPDPRTCGKGRDGFNLYKELLNNWKTLAMEQIENADDELERYKRDQKLAEKIDKNTSMIIAATVATGEKVIKAGKDFTEEIIDYAADIKNTVNKEGARTRGTVRQEGKSTREAVHKEGETTRDAVTADGITTRKTVKKEEELTRDEIQKEADRIIDTLDPIGFGQAIQSIRDAAKAAGKSIVDFIRENPALPFVAGLPLGAAVTVPKVRDALGL